LRQGRLRDGPWTVSGSLQGGILVDRGVLGDRRAYSALDEGGDALQILSDSLRVLRKLLDGVQRFGSLSGRLAGDILNRGSGAGR